MELMHQYHPSLSFARGYLITPSAQSPALPLLASWNQHRVGAHSVRTHPDTDTHFHTSERGDAWVLIGHAYDPWAGIPDEDNILRRLAAALEEGDFRFLKELDRLSGRFVLFFFRSDGTGMAVQDAVGLKNLFFAEGPHGPCFASHSQLLADVLALPRDPEIDRLVGSFFYGIGIRHLPGLSTPFLGMRMLSANTRLELPTLELQRFFPRESHPESDDLGHTARIIGDVFTASFKMLSRKKPLALSLSMGTDSRVSLAASRAFRDQIHYFSYNSDAAEEKDAVGAHELCRRLGIDHTIYRVPAAATNPTEETHLSAVLDHNAAYVRNPKPSERAKLSHLLAELPPGRMEVKTPVSEIGRAIYCKKMGVKKLPARLTPRHMSNLYKRNLFERGLLKFMDRAFAEYIRTTRFGEDFFNYEQADMFYWEHRNSAWASLANQDHDILHDMTVIFNNRDVLKWLLSPSRPDRIADHLHQEIIRYLWPEALQMPLSAMDTPKKKLRKLAERTFFAVNRF